VQKGQEPHTHTQNGRAEKGCAAAANRGVERKGSTDRDAGSRIERRSRNHRLIVLGAILEGQIIDHPTSISGQAIARDIEAHVTAHPRDRDALIDLLACLTTLPSSAVSSVCPVVSTWS
jgi:hypothetical protein